MIYPFDKVGTSLRLKIFDTDEKDHPEKKDRGPQHRKKEEPACDRD